MDGPITSDGPLSPDASMGIGESYRSNVYMRSGEKCCRARPDRTQQAHVAFTDPGTSEQLTATSYLLDAVAAETPVEYADAVADMRVSFERGHDPRDIRDRSVFDEYGPGDRDALLDSYAVKALLGDIDIHGGNIQMTADGGFYPVDFEMAGENDIGDVYDTVRMEFWLMRMEEARSVVDPGTETGLELDQDLGLGALRDRITVQADSIDLDGLIDSYMEDDRLTYRPELVEDEATAHAPAEQIVANIRDARTGDYYGPIAGMVDRLRRMV